jgi:hypothetical protein
MQYSCYEEQYSEQRDKDRSPGSGPSRVQQATQPNRKRDAQEPSDDEVDHLHPSEGAHEQKADLMFSKVEARASHCLQ